MRTAYEENRRYFRRAYESGVHGWETREPSAYVIRNLGLVAREASGRRLLDVGCGEGRHCVAAAKMGFRPIGMDYEALAVERAQAFAREASVADRIRFVAADVYALPFAPASFDMALDYGCLHHQKKADWPRYCAAIIAALRPRGWFLLSVFSAKFRVFGESRSSWHLAHGAYRRLFTSDDLRQLFDADFEFLALQEERDDVRGFWHVLMRRKAAR